jgi:hypothetical protein
VLLAPADTELDDDRGYAAMVGGGRKRHGGLALRIQSMPGGAAACCRQLAAPQDGEGLQSQCWSAGRGLCKQIGIFNGLSVQVADFGLSRPTTTALSALPRSTYGTGACCSGRPLLPCALAGAVCCSSIESARELPLQSTFRIS